MKLIGYALAVAAAGSLAACASIGNPQRRVVGTAAMLSADGQPRGQATLVRVGERLDLEVNATGLPAGTLGIHLHAVGRCVPRDFSSAGGHLNPLGRQHGTMNPMGSHLGDLPNITVDRNGQGSLDVLLEGARERIMADIFDADGTALVIHAGPDDYRTDPAGNSGSRIACGVFTQVR
ncbi:MAG: superoxide dismutase family protein [Novosphingobium sp.]|nr:superoxide dismutase family protein [Novosphingobium sp.]